MIVGGKARIHSVLSEVLLEIDVGSVRDDHFPVSCRLRGYIGRSGRARRLCKPKYDGAAMLTAEGRQVITTALRGFHPPPWSEHPDSHCQKINKFLKDILDKNFSCSGPRPRAEFITPQVWAWREAKMRMKHRTRHRVPLWSDLLERAFAQWHTGEDFSVEALIAKQGLLYQLASAAVKFVTAKIRRCIRIAKAEFLQKLVYREGDRAADVLSRAKQAGVGGNSRRTPWRPLPMLMTLDGQQAGTRHDRDRIWLEHFGRQECGEVLKLDDLLQQRVEPLVIDDELCWEPRHLPSLGDVEEVLRQAPCRKASGLDAIPGELLRASPGPMAAVLQPLMLKAAAYLRQPVQWRGGLLYEAYKQAGSHSDPSSYRSLYVASVVGKTYHKVMRNKVQDQVERTLHEFHAGGKKNVPVNLPALYVLALQRYGLRKRCSTATLFLDTHAAYYRLVRDLATGCIYSDDAVVKLFQHFALDEEDLHDLMKVVRQGGMFADGGFPATIRHVTKDIHHFTWAVTPHTTGDLVCRSEAGSRPGESWSDVVYSFIYTRVLARIAELARGEELLPDLSWDAPLGPFAEADGGEPVTGQDATWADDSAWPLIDAQPQSLLRKASRLASLVISQCVSHGMRPNLGRNKTALLYILRGKGSGRAGAEFFDHGKASLFLADVGMHLPVVNQYKHLGGLLDSKSTMTAEARRRLSMATQAFDKGRQLVYLNPTIPLEVRASVLQTAVTSTYHNLGLWLPAGKSWAMLCSGYTRLVRKLLSRVLPGDALFHLPATIAHIVTGCPPLELLARRARLSVLISMCKAGPPALWAALQMEQEWFHIVCQDLSWLASGDQAHWPDISGAAWPEWHALLRQRTAWVKRQTSRRLQADFADYKRKKAVTAVVWALYKKASAVITADGRCTPAAWVCRPCRRAFRSRGGLGAHFFKSHGRRARYRDVVSGTVCRACGKQFWGTNRLSRHLRDSPECVSTLRANGATTTEVAPGVGSRVWRKNAIEQFHPAAPEKLAPALTPSHTDAVDAIAQEAHMALCEALLTTALPQNVDEVVAIIKMVLDNHPLYDGEVRAVLELVSEEIQEVHAELLADYWSAEQLAAASEAVRGLLPVDWLVDGIDLRDVAPTPSFNDIDEVVEKVDWDHIWCSTRPKHVTPSSEILELPESWEAELLGGFHSLDVSAVRGHLWGLVPAILQTAWLSILKGHAPALRANPSFWASPLAVPFRHLQHSVQAN